MKALFFILCSQLVLLLLLFGNAHCGVIVKTLPGFDGELPFKLETGYIEVETSELFYLFVESTGDPKTDPLLIYLVGGPGCSALNGFFYQTGPLEFNTTDYSGGLPSLMLRPYPWTKSASIIFLDAPVGTGYSYTTNPKDVSVSDTSSARQTHKFIRKWLTEHPQYLENRFLVVSDSYSGIVVPVIAQYILDDNEAGVTPLIRLMGIISGSPHISLSQEGSDKVVVSHRLGLIGDRLLERAKESCRGFYYEDDVEPSNTKCLEALQKIDELLDDIYTQNVLLPNCETISPKRHYIQSRRSLRGKSRALAASQNWFCKDYAYALSYAWANNETVQEALGVRKGTVKEWYRCNLLMAELYDYDIDDAFGYHKNLTRKDLLVLLYTADHDLVVPHISTEGCIRRLNITLEDSWRPWFVEGQVAGYKIKYENLGYHLTYATLKGSGHSPTEYYNKKCYEMFERWIHNYSL